MDEDATWWELVMSCFYNPLQSLPISCRAAPIPYKDTIGQDNLNDAAVVGHQQLL